MILDIVGGSYYEICRDPDWNELYGSGLRAAHALSGRDIDITLHTFADTSTALMLEINAKAMGIRLDLMEVSETGTFYYDHPFANPILPACPINIISPKIIGAQNILVYGTIETRPIINGVKVVYDPQSPSNPESFYANGSKAAELIWISNERELFTFTGINNLPSAVIELFALEKVKAVIVKRGADGAQLFIEQEQGIPISAYQTNNVFPIGSGDIFSAVFAFEWMINHTEVVEAAKRASLATASYVNSRVLPISNNLEEIGFVKFYKDYSEVRTAYLAGPFFNMGQRWMINQLRDGLQKVGFSVFSPFHDVGIGTNEVAKKDIVGLKKSNIVVAILDEYDPGTLYEIGYAKALGIPVIALCENENEQSMTMIYGTDCIVEKDFSTLIYKALWMSK